MASKQSYTTSNSVWKHIALKASRSPFRIISMNIMLSDILKKENGFYEECFSCLYRIYNRSGNGHNRAPGKAGHKGFSTVDAGEDGVLLLFRNLNCCKPEKYLYSEGEADVFYFYSGFLAHLCLK